MNRLLSFAAALALVASAVPASAAVIHWTVTGATFDDGSALDGSFDVDSSSNVASNFLFEVDAGTLSALTYDSSNSQFIDFGAGRYIFAHHNSPTSYDRYISLQFDQPLTTAGTFAIATTSTQSYECGNCSPMRYITAGSVTSDAVPEPAMLGLFGLGALGLGLARHRKA